MIKIGSNKIRTRQKRSVPRRRGEATLSVNKSRSMLRLYVMRRQLIYAVFRLSVCVKKQRRGKCGTVLKLSKQGGECSNSFFQYSNVLVL